MNDTTTLRDLSATELAPTAPGARIGADKSGVVPSVDAPLRVALVGVPNCGKTALFNRLTGSRQKVANYPGVTVERKLGEMVGATGRRYRIVDLPGTYSLIPTTLDEAITRDVILGRLASEPPPELIVCVADMVHLPVGLKLLLDIKRLGLPMIVVLNRADAAERAELRVDARRLSAELGVPVVTTIAIAKGGTSQLLEALDRHVRPAERTGALDWQAPTVEETLQTQQNARALLNVCGYREPAIQRWQRRFDAIVLHPVAGMALLAALLFVVFQAVFSWAVLPMELIATAVASVGDWVSGSLSPGPLRSLLVNGVIAGAGSVLVFLPQILILFLFILALEDSGYLPRAAYLLDRVMGSVGLSGRAFIPLLSSFACAIPGIMAARTIPSWRDRISTIMVAPLMTCSARLPIYALLIAAFIPARSWGPFNIQGLVLFALYFAGIASALAVAYVLKRTVRRGEYSPLMLELPDYQWPNLSNLLHGLWDRVRIFLRRVGGIILSLMVVLWFLSSYPGAPAGATQPAIYYSFAGMIGRTLEYVFAPLGFNWQISIALVPGMAAREVAIGALGTVYAMSASSDELASSLAPIIGASWSFATACSLLAWYVFAPQCLSTLAVVKRETNSWRYPLIMAGYLFALAYIGAFVTYRVVRALGWGAA
ncbi:MAG: ferrous iron transporter B [Pseudomonadales bacterium]|nr:ferrous iron transporter B [Pseudomonadales bacterium]